MNPTWLYVALIYAAAVWLARRGGVALPWKIASFFYALVLLFLFEPMTQECVNVPIDYLKKLTPWASVTRDHHVVNGQMNDVPLQMVPWAHQVRESWKSLHFPLWNARSGSGYPLLANGQSAALSLVRIAALPLPLGYSLTVEAAMKLLLALTFTFLLCRRRGYSELASSMGAVSFGFCSFLAVWLHFPHSTVACMTPAVLLAIDLLAERVTYPRLVFSAIVGMLLLFGGHPETAFHIVFLGVLLAVWILAVERPFATPGSSVRFIAALGAAAALSALLAAPFLLPFAEALPRSQRFRMLRIFPHAPSPFNDFGSKVLLLEPHFYGDVPFEAPWGPAVAESITGFAGVLGFAGSIALLLYAIWERRFRSRELFFVVATLIVLGIILSWPVIGTLFHALFKLAANARMRMLLAFLLALQAAAAVDLLERERGRPLLIGLAVAAALLLGLVMTVHFPGEWQRDSTLLALLPSLSVIFFATIAAVAGRARAATLMLLLVCVVNELWSVGMSWNPVLPQRLMYPQTPIIRRLQELQHTANPTAPFRIVAIGPYFFPNLSAVYGLQDIRAHDPMSNGGYLGLLRVVAGYDVSKYFAMWEDLDTRIIDYLNVRYVLTPRDFDVTDRQRYALVYEGRDGRIFENRDALPRFYTVPIVVLEFKRDEFVKRLVAENDWAHTAVLRALHVENDRERTDILAPRPPGSPEATLTILDAGESDYRMQIVAPRYTLVVSSVPWWPGWKIERNGQSLEPVEVNGAFLGYVVPAGVFTVHVYYDPLSFKAGLIASTITLIGLFAPFAARRRRRT